jgi:hypothetical protein
MPLPAGISFEEEDGVREFMEREERRRKQIEVCIAISELFGWLFISSILCIGSCKAKGTETRRVDACSTFVF